MKHRSSVWFRALLGGLATLCLMTSAAVAQQVSGTISGSVRDNQGAVIPNAKVVLLDVRQGDQRETQSNNEGAFVFNSIKPSTYNVSVEFSGFKKYEQKDIRVFANDRIELREITMEIGGVSESIVVEASAAQIQTRGAEKAGILTGNQITNLSLFNRTFLDLTKTIPGVVQNGGVGGSVNGNRNNQNNLTVDGVTNIDTGSNGGQLATMNIDMIGEFKILTNAQPAEFGRSSGAQIAVVTKGGTRDFHGTGYLFHRHEGLNANNWLNNQQPQADGKARQRNLFRNNTYGFNVGGPAYIPGKFNRNKDKLFFFVGIEWQKALSPNTLRNVTVPTALQRAGNFSETRDGSGRAVTIQDPQDNKAPFAGNIIPANRISADGQKILNFYPTPNANDVAFNYQSQKSDTFPRKETIFRGDYNISDKWRFYSRYMYTKSEQDRAYGQWNADYNIPFAPMNFGNPGWSVITNLTTVINPTLTNEFIFGSSRNVLNIDPVDDTFKRSKLNLAYKMPFPDADKLDLIQNWRFGDVPNAPFTGFNGTPFRNFNHTWDFTDNVSKISGAHQFKFGVYIHKSQKDQTAFTSINGDINFGRNGQNPLDTNWGFSNAILGNFNDVAQSNVVLNGQYRNWNIEWYAQDSWRLSKKLTVDYGMRFYWIQPQYDAALQTSSFNPGLYQAAKSAVLVQPFLDGTTRVGRNPVTGALTPAALIGSLVQTGNGFTGPLYTNGIGLAGKDGYPAGLLNDRGIHFAPRLGLAYQVMEKTVIRTGIGIFYDRFQGNPVFDMLPNPPSTNRPQFFFSNLSQLSSLSGTYFPAGVRGFDQGGNVPTTINYNFSIQRELPKAILLDVGYVGSRGTHLLARTNLNALPFGSAWQPQNQDPTASAQTLTGSSAKIANLYRPYLGYGDLSITNFGGSSNYHSLQVSANRRFGSGLTGGLAYTWSKALGVASGDGDTLHPTNFKMANYSYLDFDVPHNLVINFTYDIPNLMKSFGKDNKVSNVIFGGWQVSALSTMALGQPADITVNIQEHGGDRNRIYTGSESVAPRTQLTGNPNGPKGIGQYIDTSVFKAPTIGSLGLESAQRIVRRPGINNWDATIFKNIPFGSESRYLQLRCEMFNAFNHTQFSDFNRSVTFNRASGQITNLPTSVGGGGGRYGFGAITTARDPRFIQLAVKLYF